MSACIATGVAGLRRLLERPEPAGSACISHRTEELQGTLVRAETAP